MDSKIKILCSAQTPVVHFDWGNLRWFANRSIGNSNEMTIGRCVLKPGCSNPRHYHPNCTEILVVVHGRIRHTIDGGKEAELGEGDTVTIPQNAWHCAANIGDGEAVLYISFSSANRQTVHECPERPEGLARLEKT